MIADILERHEVRLGPAIYLPMDPASEFGYIGGAEGDPERVRGQNRILVPVYPWKPLGLDEEAILASILVEASKSNPLKVGKLSDTRREFWRPYRALLRHPTVEVPSAAIPQVASEEVPRDGVIIITGTATPLYVVQGNRRNIFAWHRRSLISVEFFLSAAT